MLPDDFRSELLALYNEQSKHSQYQNLPEFARVALNVPPIDETWRGDTARLKALMKAIPFARGTSCGDIGANTGYFTLSFAHANPQSEFVAYEGNAVHARLIALLAKSFGMGNVITKHEWMDRAGLARLGHHEVLLHLNVLHHAGVDFDRHLLSSRQHFMSYAIEYMGTVGTKADILIFQQGYNWGGNRQEPLVHRDDEWGKLILSTRILQTAGWQLKAILIADRRSGDLAYRPLSAEAVDEITTMPTVPSPTLAADLAERELQQFPGEFYRRPILIASRFPRAGSTPQE